jgi:hypothetical protein
MPGKAIGKQFKFKTDASGRTKVVKGKPRRTAVHDTIGRENKAKRQAARWDQLAPGRVTVQKLGRK